jgi:hypothetical protein
MSAIQIPLPPLEMPPPSNSSAEPDGLWLSCNRRIDIEKVREERQSKEKGIYGHEKNGLSVGLPRKAGIWGIKECVVSK